ncbi:DUF3311 domain-containing protein [Paenibacillus cremeus]|uniref:DUF3311 domain-containing protein n=1 Tax=Paenibacillus cremeus TaxID=2163881 RepID=A0A559K6R4_9BACL|nr:DUF3311 domain-containing protein [Paenibacillus cremeus]TVY07820.1 DUF3311 domain-containing protein [Paenibacillus cremeus]
MPNPSTEKKAGRGWYLLLILPFLAMLWPASYSTAEPTLIGMPFFYWYQMLWVIISALLTVVVYFATKRK